MAAVAAAKAVDPNDSATYQNYLHTLTATQQQIGVENPRLLSNYQVSSLVQKLSSVDPAKGDVGVTLDAVAKEYGDQWPQVFGELVSKGKLDPNYQVLATMDTPSQLTGRADFQRALLTPLDQLKAQAGKDAAPLIDGNKGTSPIDTELDEFRKTTQTGTPGAAAVYSMVRSSVQRLAYFYAGAQGMEPTTALKAAADAIVNDKYDYLGSMRVPTGMLPDVKAATAQVQSGLKPGDLQDISGNPYLTQDERQGIYVGAAKAGKWVPNRDDTGLNLLMTIRNGGQIVVRRADGSPVEVKFDDVRAGKYNAAPILDRAGSVPADAAHYGSGSSDAGAMAGPGLERGAGCSRSGGAGLDAGDAGADRAGRPGGGGRGLAGEDGGAGTFR